MKRKPTLAQLKKRPALWWDEDFEATRISYPCGKVLRFWEEPDAEWVDSSYTLGDLVAFKESEFIGWL